MSSATCEPQAKQTEHERPYTLVIYFEAIQVSAPILSAREGGLIEQLHATQQLHREHLIERGQWSRQVSLSCKLSQPLTPLTIVYLDELQARGRITRWMIYEVAEPANTMEALRETGPLRAGQME